MDIDSHAEELASALGVDKTEVKTDLQNLLQYSVPIDEAKQSIRRKHGGGGSPSSTPETVSIEDVTTDHGSVNVTVRVVTVGTRTIQYQGEESTIREGKLADETGVISYTSWQDFGFEPGDSLTIGNAGVREWDGHPELNLGANTTVAFAEESVSVPYDIGGDATLLQLEPGDRGRTVEVRVIEVEKRTINGRNGETEILSGVLADETTRLPFTDWQPRSEISEGAEVRIEDVYVREFRGAPSINLSEFSTVSPLERSIDINDEPPELSIAEAVGAGGMYDVAVTGTILEIRDGSGLIERCPDCGRVIQNGQCRSHGAVDGEDDLRIKAIVDDGTEALTAILGTELTADIYGGGVESAKDAAREAMDKGVVTDEIAETLVGRAYRLRGRLSVDEYGANLTVDEFEAIDESPADAARAVLTEVRS